MSFKIEDCAIPTLWCGNKKIIPTRNKSDEKYYTRKGTPLECMKQGFGAGVYTEKKKHLDKKSLQNIKYVGETYENNFNKKNIYVLEDLLSYASTHTAQQIKKLLTVVFKKKGGVLDQRAYNSTILFIYKNGISSVPQCSKISR